MRIVIRVDGGGWRGMGHVARCEAIGAELLRTGHRVEYATRTKATVDRLARVAPTVRLVGPSDADALAAMDADRVVVDLPYPTAIPDAFVVPRSHVGDWPCAIVRREFREWRDKYRRTAARWTGPNDVHPPKTVYVTGGATDGHGLLVPILEALALMDAAPSPVVADGSIDDVPATMATCDIAIISYGVTALECACVGLPAVYVCPTEAHEVGASALDAAGCGVNLGVHGRQCGELRIAQWADRLLAAPEEMAAMSAAGRALIDGRGAERVARRIVGE